MTIPDFKKMFYTSFGRVSINHIDTIYEMLLPLILDGSHPGNVSIGNISQFIDFFNYVPVLIKDIRHKNDSSADLQLYMGKTKEKNTKEKD